MPAPRKQTKEEPETTRLTSVRVREVSLVDRGANRRRWLITKRDEDMGKQLVADGRGGFILKADDEDEEEKKKKEEEAKKAAGSKKDDDADKGDDSDGDDEDGKKKSKTEKGKDDADKDDDADEDDDANKKKSKAEKGKGKDKADDEDEEEDTEKVKKVDMLVAVSERILSVAKQVKSGKEMPENFGDEVAKMMGKIVKSNKGDGDDRITKMESELAELRGTVSKQASKIDAQNSEIEKLRDEPGASHSRTPEGSGGSGDQVTWPSDLAKSETKDDDRTF